jgi:NAD(P)H-dependent FMN reductase
MNNLLAFSGSSRLNSLNSLLLSHAVELATEAGAQVEVIDLGDLNLPIYDGDYEQSNGLPEGARLLKLAMQKADGFLMASPEYNSFPTPLLLNALDWASRAESKDEAPLSAFKGKAAGLIATSPGPMGGIRSLTALRSKLQNIGVTVVPTMAAVGSGSVELFSSSDFTTQSQSRRVKTTINELLSLKV